MVQKRYCDVCGVEIPNPAIEEHNVAARMYSGTFLYAAIGIDESDDLCSECGAKVRDFIRQLKKEKEKCMLKK